MQKTKKDSFDRAMLGESFLALIEYFNHPAWIRDIEGRYLWVNDGFLKLRNAKREDVINKLVTDLHPSHIAQQFSASEKEAIEKRCPLTFLIETKEYKRVIYKSPIFSDDNEIIATAGLAIDLPQERELETQLNSLKNFYHSVLANMGEALIFANKNGNFEFYNKRAEEVLSAAGSKTPSNYQEWVQLFPKRYDKNGKKLPISKGFFMSALKGENIINEEAYLETESGYRMAVRASAVPFKSKKDDSVLGVILTINDITKEKQLIDRLAKKTKLIEQRNQELHQFAYSAAHDLCDPLRNISLSTSLIYEKIKAKEYDGIEELLERLLKTTSYGSSLIKNLLDYSAANREMQMERVFLDEVTKQTITALSNLIEQAKAKIIFTKLPAVLGNQQQLQIVFQNIISNAIRYKGSDPLRISISAYRKKSLWVISIQDNGPGIKEEFKHKIFLPFQRLGANNATGRSSGLGLSICRRIIEQHGGEIWLDPHSSPGACFKFTLKGAG